MAFITPPTTFLVSATKYISCKKLYHLYSIVVNKKAIPRATTDPGQLFKRSLQSKLCSAFHIHLIAANSSGLQLLPYRSELYSDYFTLFVSFVINSIFRTSVGRFKFDPIKIGPYRHSWVIEFSCPYFSRSRARPQINHNIARTGRKCST